MTGYETLHVCGDCVQAAANGIDEGLVDYPAGFVAAFNAQVEARGSVPVPVADGDFTFSWGGCPWCGSTQGGDRFKVELPVADRAVMVHKCERGQS